MSNLRKYLPLAVVSVAGFFLACLAVTHMVNDPDGKPSNVMETFWVIGGLFLGFIICFLAIVVAVAKWMDENL